MVDDELAHPLAVSVKRADLLLDVVSRRFERAGTVQTRSISSERAQARVHVGLVEDLAHADAGARALGRVSWSNTALGGADGALAEGGLLHAVDDLVQAEDDVGAAADLDAAGRVEPLALDGLELLEEARDVHDAARADEVLGARAQQAARKDCSGECAA